MIYRSSAGEITIEPEGDGYRVAVGTRLYHVIVRRAEEGRLAFDVDGQQHRASVAIHQGRTFVASEGSTYVLEPERNQRRHGTARPGGLTAAMPGQVVAIYVAVGDQVEQGQPLLLLTAMKMEVTVSALESGVVRAVAVGVGDIVARDQPLIEVAPVAQMPHYDASDERAG